MHKSASELLGYHEETKHHFNRFAKSAGFLDWQTQPVPWRTYEGAARYDLPRRGLSTPTYDKLWDMDVPALEINEESLGSFLYLSAAISAWKQSGESKWALRVNPSSGNLHPTEVYLGLPTRESRSNLPGGRYHYRPVDHSLESRSPDVQGLPLGEGEFLLALSTIPWREAWKYGERAYRYCCLDAGHMIGALQLSALMHGWVIRPLSVKGGHINAYWGMDEDDAREPEFGDCVFLVGPAETGETAEVSEIDTGGLEACEDYLSFHLDSPFDGIKNVLSPSHREWDLPLAAARDSEVANGRSDRNFAPSKLMDSHPRVAAGDLVRKRRSAVDMDGSTSVAKEDFFYLLEDLLPHKNTAFWPALPSSESIEVVMYVHRVDGLDPGLYLLQRGGAAGLLEALGGGEKVWEHLWFIQNANMQNLAKQVSCQQDIASRGVAAFSLLAPLETRLEENGPAAFKELYWEAGALGHLLYTGAEAIGIQATGIGCFFDDVIREVTGLDEGPWQVLYNFTIGGGICDDRVQNLDAYHHLDG